MARVKRGFKARQRRNKVLKLAKGFHFDRRTKYKHASETVRRALHYAFIGRRLLKRDIRKLWKSHFPSEPRIIEFEANGLKVIADFAIQFPQDV